MNMNRKLLYRIGFFAVGASFALSLSCCFYFYFKIFFQGPKIDVSFLKKSISHLKQITTESENKIDFFNDNSEFDNDFFLVYDDLNKKLDFKKSLRHKKILKEEKRYLAIIKENRVMMAEVIPKTIELPTTKEIHNLNNYFTGFIQNQNQNQNKIYKEEKRKAKTNINTASVLEEKEDFFPERDIATITMSSTKKNEILSKESDDGDKKTPDQPKERKEEEKEKEEDLVFFSSDEHVAKEFNSEKITSPTTQQIVEVKEKNHPPFQVLKGVLPNVESVGKILRALFAFSQNLIETKKNNKDNFLTLDSQSSQTIQNASTDQFEVGQSNQNKKAEENESDEILSDSNVLEEIEKQLVAKNNQDKEYAVGKLLSSEELEKSRSITSVRVFKANLGKGIDEQTPIKYDINQVYDVNKLFERDFEEDERDSNISTLQVYLNEENSTLPIYINAGLPGEFYVTNMDVPLEKGFDRTFEIPLFSIPDFELFIQKKYPELLGRENGFIILKLIDLTHIAPDAKILNIEVGEDNKLEGINNPIKYFCFNRNFKYLSTEFSDDCYYYLVTGISPGKHQISYQIKVDGRVDVATKIVIIPSGEIYFEEVDFHLQKRKDSFELFEHHLTALKLSENPSSFSKIRSFTNGKEVSRGFTGGNSFELLNPLTPTGSRHYYAISQGDKIDDIYVGKNSANKIIVPTLEYQNFKKNEFIQSELLKNEELGCVIQVNLSKNVINFSINGRSDVNSYGHNNYEYDDADGDMELHVRYWDERGFFSKEVSPITKNIFVIGNGPGIITARIEYKDRTNDYFISHCDRETYLVEQF